MLLLDSRQLVPQAALLYLTQGGLTQTLQNQWFCTWLYIEERGKLELVMDVEPLYRELVPQLINQQ